MSNAGQLSKPRLSPFISPMPGKAGQYIVNRPGEWEQVRWSFYDSAAYPAAGANSLQFFQSQNGAGGKTLSDTNMPLSSMIQQGNMFLVESVEVHFFPTTPTGGAAAQLPAAIGAQAAALLVNDVYIFRRSGNLVFTIGGKPYLQEAPMMRFPPKAQFAVAGALSDATTAAATQQNRLAMGEVIGRPYILTPDQLLLDAGQSFGVVLAWPEGLQAITNPARVMVVLDGELFRLSQ